MGSGRQVTDAQVKELRRHLQHRGSLQKAAMKAGMDRKSARKYRDRGQLPSECQAEHTWRTRVDPLVQVWPRLQELLEREPGLQAKTLVDWLQREYPGQDWQRQRRTVERRVRQWKAEHGPAKELFFTQEHPPGRLGSSDFTHMESLGVTIQGQPFAHLAYHFVLTCSNWESVTLCFSESFASLSEGLQNALWELGGVPERHRTDRMTLAVHHDGNPEQYTAHYKALLSHYGLTPEATNAYSGHENGDCEQGHRRFKEALAQELMLRGSGDFTSREAYWQFVRGVVARRNAGRGVKMAEEESRLRPLPAQRLETLERRRVRVSQGATIQVKKNTYSVPARLRGEMVETRISAETIAVWYAGSLVQTMERLRGQSKHRIDYRHVIDWLVRKPGAFARYVYREDLYPTLTFRRAYDALQEQQPARADREYLQFLHLAAQEGEAGVEAVLARLLDQGGVLSEQVVRTLLGRDTPLSLAGQVSAPTVDLRSYDALLEGAWAAEMDSQEANDEHGSDGDVDALPAGTTAGECAQPVRGSGPPGDGGVVELHSVLDGVAGTRVSAPAAPPHRALAEGVAAAPGEELGEPRPAAFSHEGDAAVAWPVERRLPGPARERADVRPAGLGQDARAECGVSGVGACRPADPVGEVQLAGAGTAEGQARSALEGDAARPVALAGPAHRRPGLRAAESGGDGSAVHAARGALRAWQCADHEQPGLLAVGEHLQGSDDDGGSHRPTGAPQRDRGTERAQLPHGGRQAQEGIGQANPGVRGGERGPAWGPGYAAVAGAALRLPPLRQGPTLPLASGGWGFLIVANGEG